MANTFTVLFRGAASTSSATLYTVPAATQTLITTFIISNTTAADQTFTITAGGVELASGSTVAPNDSTIIEFKTLMDAADTITALASSTSVKFHVTGLEIS
jgi:hypothetical protein